MDRLGLERRPGRGPMIHTRRWELVEPRSNKLVLADPPKIYDELSTYALVHAFQNSCIQPLSGVLGDWYINLQAPVRKTVTCYLPSAGAGDNLLGISTCRWRRCEEPRSDMSVRELPREDGMVQLCPDDLFL